MTSANAGEAGDLPGRLMKRGIVYGSLAIPIKKPETDHTHRWTVFVRGLGDRFSLESDGTIAAPEITAGTGLGNDVSTFIKRVSFKLHDSFAQPLRNIEKAPFEVNETGWGEFQIQIKVTFHDPLQRPITLNHHLRLYPPEDLGQLKTSKPVLSQFYDEIYFEPATETMAKLLEPSEDSSQLEANPKYSELMAEEAKEIAHINSVIDLVKAQLEEINGKLALHRQQEQQQQQSTAAIPTTASNPSQARKKVKTL